MHFIPEELDDYVVAHSENEPELLQQLNRETYQKILQPRMLSGHYQGRILSMISKLVNPVNILEIGTYTGYSALCLIEGMQKSGELHTIDINEELVDFQRKYFDKSGFGNQIHQHLGNALEIIPKLDISFDLIFIDGHHDGTAMMDYLELVFPMLSENGCVVVDDIRWSSSMNEAWMKVQKNPRFGVSLDLFELGVLIKRPTQTKQHFVLKY